MQRFLYIAFLVVAFTRTPAQTVSGSWYGHADVDLAGMHNNYLTELVIKQKGTRVEGIFGYYFRDKYQSFFIHGRYDPQTREITILNIPVTFYGSTSTINSVDCITNFRGILIRSKMGSTVKGTFYHDEKYKYTCPDIKVSYDLDKADNQTDSTISAGAVAARVWKPKEDDFVVDASQPVAKPAINLPSTAAIQPDSPVASTLPATLTPDTSRNIFTPPPVDPSTLDSKNLAESFAKRKAVGNRVYEVESDSVRLSFYDNGEIDGDSISVFVNSNLVLSHQQLDARAFNLYLKPGPHPAQHRPHGPHRWQEPLRGIFEQQPDRERDDTIKTKTTPLIDRLPTPC
jgi:hypothetical protein